MKIEDSDVLGDHLPDPSLKQRRIIWFTQVDGIHASAGYNSEPVLSSIAKGEQPGKFPNVHIVFSDSDHEYSPIAG